MEANHGPVSYTHDVQPSHMQMHKKKLSGCVTGLFHCGKYHMKQSYLKLSIKKQEFKS